jgi:predicted DNA-binding ribbon-helix-helix protein
MAQLNVFSQVNAHQARFVDREINANSQKRSPHVTRALSHSASIQGHLIGVRKRACAELEDAICWAAASVGRDRKLKVVRVVLRSLAGDYLLTSRIKLLVMLWLTSGRVDRILHGCGKMRLEFDLWDGKKERDFIDA